MQNVRGIVLVLLTGLAGGSPAVAEPPPDKRPAAEAFERLEGTWSRKPQGGQEESIVVCFDRKDGRVTRSIIKLTLGQGPRSVYLSEVKIRASGQKGVITLVDVQSVKGNWYSRNWQDRVFNRYGGH
jgi:hypothetical protein